MKKYMLIAAFAALTVGANAQDKQPKTAQERAKAQTERLTKDLGLNAEQAAKAEAINLRYAEKAEAEHKEQKADREVRMKEGQAVRDAHRAEMKAVLTAEQYDTWIKKQDAMKEKRMEHRKSMHGDRAK